MVATLPLVHSNGLPDDKDFDNYGCEVNPVPFGCLSCPLPVCVYDMPDRQRQKQEARLEQRRQKLRELLTKGVRRRDELATQLGISMRVLHRDLQALRR